MVWKDFHQTFINGIDYNRWNGPHGPVIRRCSTVAERNDPQAMCSNGPIYFDTTSGRARYVGLLVRLEKRLSRGTQFLASYALGSFVGSNGTGTGTTEAPGGRVFGFNNDSWLENYGPLPTDQRHILNLSGFVELPWQLQLAVGIFASSAPPVAPYVQGMDFNGDGTVNDLLPGTSINQFGGDLGKDDLARLVQAYNQQYADRQTAGGQRAPRLALARRLFVQRWFLHAGPAPVPYFQPGPQSTAIGRVRRSLQCSEYAQPGWIRHEPSTDRFLRPADRAVQPGVRIGRAARIPTGRAGYFLARPGPSTAAQYSRRPSDSCAMTRSRKRSSSSTSSLRKTVSAMVSRSVARNSFLSR